MRRNQLIRYEAALRELALEVAGELVVEAMAKINVWKPPGWKAGGETRVLLQMLMRLTYIGHGGAMGPANDTHIGPPPAPAQPPPPA